MLNLENLCRSLWVFTVLSCMYEIFYNKGKKFSAWKRKLVRNWKYHPKFKTKKILSWKYSNGSLNIIYLFPRIFCQKVANCMFLCPEGQRKTYLLDPCPDAGWHHKKLFQLMWVLKYQPTITSPGNLATRLCISVWHHCWANEITCCARLSSKEKNKPKHISLKKKIRIYLKWKIYNPTKNHNF